LEGYGLKLDKTRNAYRTTTVDSCALKIVLLTYLLKVRVDVPAAYE